jgi:hypothetical protein
MNIAIVWRQDGYIYQKKILIFGMIFEVILSSLLEQWNKTKIFPKGTYRTDHISYAYEHCTLEGEVVEFGSPNYVGKLYTDLTALQVCQNPGTREML